jgi:hypothetical protein
MRSVLAGDVAKIAFDAIFRVDAGDELYETIH